jgi:DNA-binding NtrC family response regulator
MGRSASDVNVIIFASVRGVAETLRMALRGTGVRTVFLASHVNQMLEGFSGADPHVAMIYVESAAADDPGMQMLTFIRRSDASPNRAIPVVVVSQQRDMTTFRGAIDAGAHEYVLFPVAGDALLKKVDAARNSNRPFIDTPEYVGPERRVLPPQ